MKKNLFPIFFIALIACFAACTKSGIATYGSKPAVYFSSFTDQADSLVYSFAGNPNSTDTVYLTVQLLGDSFPTARQFKVVVNPDSTTARAGVDFDALQASYTFPAHSFSATVPIVLHNGDTTLNSKYLSLALTLVPSADLNTGLPTQLNARILFTNQITEPSYWASLLELYYGDYSTVKHQICIRLQGFDFPATQAAAIKAPYSYSFWMSWGRVADQYFTTNTVYDENGNLIMPWASF